jgi:hypothetical protein
MEARVWSATGLLPAHLETVRLTELDDGRWQAWCEDHRGRVRTLQFESDDAQAQVQNTLRQDFGFTDYAAEETTRRLFEPFEMAANWPW